MQVLFGSGTALTRLLVAAVLEAHRLLVTDEQAHGTRHDRVPRTTLLVIWSSARASRYRQNRSRGCEALCEAPRRIDAPHPANRPAVVN